MNLALKIARRYLFAKKSTNAINIITGIAVFGIAVGTAALVLVLSVFNGFEDLITNMYSAFNPDVKITPIEGKTFQVDSTKIKELYGIEGVMYVSQSLEEVAYFEYKDNQDIGIVKGVDDLYNKVSGIDSTVLEGSYKLREGNRNTAILGLGMRDKLGVNIDDQLATLSVYMPKRKRTSVFQQQFNKHFIYPAGTFVIQTEYNNQYVLTSLDFARRLLDYKNEVSALEIRLDKNYDEATTVKAIKTTMGESFAVKNRYQQQESFLKLMQMEKWLSFAIVGLMMLMISFNMIGALWMVVLEKKEDIAILKSMGATDRLVRRIFLGEGLLLSFLGICIGFLLALIIYGLQKNIGIVSVPGEFIIDAYPISIRIFDFTIVAITVSAIGWLASLAPALRAERVPAMIKEE
ncbi:MAG: membrane protein [Saprospiraceae bacterium]|nr:MAG: membrane protein [Saprospiraceae bacterium]